MDFFPKEIARNLRKAGSHATLIPIQIEADMWESALFLEVGGNECQTDRDILRQADKPFPVGIEADNLNRETAAIVMLRFEVHTRKDNPLSSEILLAPGKGSIEFSTLDHLTKQSHLRMFFADRAYKVVHSQQISLNSTQRQGFSELLSDAVNHDALLRLTGKYDAPTALASVREHYAPRGTH